MRRVGPMIAGWLGLASGCSYVEVPVTDPGSPNGTRYVIARTLEFGNMLNHIKNRVVARPRGEGGGRYGFLSFEIKLDIFPASRRWVPLEGMNEASFTVSANEMWETKYERPAIVGEGDVFDMELPSVLLRTCASVDEALAWLARHRVVGPGAALGFHYTLTDASGRSVIVEYIGGQRLVYENTARVMTNDPPFEWHLRNLNTYVNLSPVVPHQNDILGVDTSVGKVPRTVGHGWNLHGLPGDSSSPSRFAQLFYLRGYATSHKPPRTTDDGIVLASALLNKVFIPLGSVARDNGLLPDAFEYTPWAIVKIPSEKRVLFRGYRNLRWREIDLRKLDFTKTSSWEIEDGTLGVDDVTTQGQASPEQIV